MSHIQVIGAGFTGTLAAWLLKRRGDDVTLVDPAPRSGGIISTMPQADGDLETAANGFMASPLIEQVAQDLGVQLVPASPVARRHRFLWSPGAQAPERWPLSPGQTVGAALRFAWARLARKAQPTEYETVEQWGHRVLGHAATDQLLATALLGIYAAPIHRLSASLILGRFFRPYAGTSGLARRARLKGTVAPRGGMGEWFAAMDRWLERYDVRREYRRASPLESGHPATILATGAPEAAALLQRVAPALSQAIGSIEMVPLISVAVFAKADSTDRHGFGCLFHPQAGFHSLGTLWSSDIFPHRFQSGIRAETWIVGGAVNPSVVQLDDEKIVQQVLQDRTRLGFSGPVASTVVTRWRSPFPLYGTRLEATVRALPDAPDGVLLAGNYLGALGLSRLAEKLHGDIEGFHP